ncbi:uncharacterized protein LOC132607659 [Lycium barbarum]|uniref:uncharacterized protein LOC132607659 n=1 Tax=Lycium barbarum TaxID=112863 RepID=UPI00293F422D|nr:uncharacterized protein LOC132607659 [Lycium barbarum]
MLETLSKRIDSNEKKVEDYNSRVDQILGAPPILTGPETKYIVRRPFPPSATPKLISKRFKMPDIPKYDGTTDPQEHITAYTCAITGNDLKDDEIESVMLKKFGETLTKRAMQWHCTLPQHSIPSFELLVDAFVQAHAGARKVQARKDDIFKIFQRDDERLIEFVTKFQKERMLLPSVPDEYEPKTRVEDDQLEFPPGPVNLIKNSDRPKRVIETKFQPSRDIYHPYPHPERFSSRSDKGKNDPSPNTTGSDRRSDRGSGSRGLQFKNNTVGMSDIGENPRLFEYNFNVKSAAIVAAIDHIKNARWPRPLRNDPS